MGHPGGVAGHQLSELLRVSGKTIRNDISDINRWMKEYEIRICASQKEGYYIPIIFGTPIIMNPFLMIPFVLGPVLIAAVNYLAMSTGLAGLPLWEAPGFLPPGFQAFLLTLDWKAAVMSVLNVVVMTVIYYPFFKMMEADELKKEMAGK